MSDRYNPLGVTSLVRPQSVGLSGSLSGQFGSGGMTEYEQNLNPYYDQLMEKEQRKRRWMKPVQWILDRLQTGQYVSANIANEIIDALDRDQSTQPEFLQAIWEGITGETKGTYENILRDRLNVGRGKLFPNAPENTRRGQVDWADIIGFIADVALDPATYFGFGLVGNSTKVAKNAAKEFADDAVRVMLRTLDGNADLALKAIGPGADDIVRKALGATSNRGMGMLRRAGGDFGRFVEQAYNSAYQSALTRTQSELVDFMQRAVNIVPEGSAVPGDLLTRLTTQTAYQGAGERYGARVLGREVAKHGTGGAKRGIGQRSWERFAQLFSGANPGDSKFSNAVWGAFNRGPIGEIRRALGFRNPYQKFLRANELEQGIEYGTWAVSDATQQVGKAIGDLSDEQMNEVFGLFAQREARQKVNREIAEEMPGDIAAGQKQLFEAYREPMAAATEILSEDPAVNAAVERLGRLTDSWYWEEYRWAKAMGETPAEYRKWYMPEYFKDTAGGTGGNRVAQRQFTVEENIARQIEYQRAVWGVDEATARELVERNATSLSTDLRTNMINRAMVHGRIQARFNMVQKFKEFGVDLRPRAEADEMVDVVAEKMNALYLAEGKDLRELGVRGVKNDALAGYVFDYDVADIIDRTLDVTGPQRNVFTRGMKAFSNWWKSIVTMTTGFHARNFISNWTTQFLRHGSRAFNKDDILMATAAVAHTLREGSQKAFLQKLNMTPEWLNKYLNRRVGNFTVRELADYAAQRGVISRATMGFDPEDIVKQMTKPQGGALWRGQAAVPGKGVLWKEGGLRQASRDLGAYVENIPRMESFLIDYRDMARMGADLGQDISEETARKMLWQIDEPALSQAGREAKKWFIDYQDLSKFEQETMKSVIPFYSWLRKNLANQISGIFLYPDLYSILPKLEDLAAYEDPNYDPALVPEWLRESGAFPLGYTESGDLRMFRPDLAHMDLNLIPLAWEEGSIWPTFTGEQLRDELINSTAPWIRQIARFMIDSENPYNFFYKSEMEPTSPAPYTMRLFASRPGAMVLVDGLLRMAGFENGAQMDVEDGRLRIDSRMALILEEYLPLLRQLDMAFYLPQTIGTFQGEGPIEKAIENFTGAQDNYEGSEQFFQMLSHYLGIKTSDVELDKERMKLGRDIYYDATEMYNAIRRETDPTSQQRSLQARQRTQASIRRLGG